MPAAVDMALEAVIMAVGAGMAEAITVEEAGMAEAITAAGTGTAAVITAADGTTAVITAVGRIMVITAMVFTSALPGCGRHSIPGPIILISLIIFRHK
jgi:hypothetical protein